ncbi:MAG: peptidoglycan DD-metalloendopeptidase family protein [Desulfobacterales bacterium]
MFCFFKTVFKGLKILIVLIALPNYGVAAHDIERFHERAENLARKMAISQEQIANLLQQETAVLVLLEQIDMKLDALKNQISEYRSELLKLDKELQKAGTRARGLEIKIDSMRSYAQKRLVAIYKMNRMGTFAMMASADSLSEFLFRKNALERVFEYDEKMLGIMIQDQAELERLLAEINIQKEKKLELETELKGELSQIYLERENRSRILAEIRNKKSLEHELAEAYREAAIILNNTIALLSREKDEQNVEGFVADQPFDTFKGLLNMPVSGTITSRFGSCKDKELNVERFNSGIFFRTDRGEPVHAVKDGRILFAGWFKGYGKMIIIDHGHHYYTIYAHAEELFKDKGDPVESGEVIATVGDSGSVSGPELYFEVRHHGKPVDPLEWIKKG